MRPTGICIGGRLKERWMADKTKKLIVFKKAKKVEQSDIDLHWADFLDFEAGTKIPQGDYVLKLVTEEERKAEEVRRRLLGLDYNEMEIEVNGQRYIYHKGIEDAEQRFLNLQERNLFKR